MPLAPIALFVYNRPLHTRAVIEALKENDLAGESELYIFSDGAKNEDAKQKVDEVRNYIRTITGFKKVEIIERNENLGLAKSIISGVTDIINRFGKIVVLEDDLVTSRFFLRFMNDALDFYESNNDVISIHGYIYPVRENLPETFFLRGADCWGWATWKRGWDLFEVDGRRLLDGLIKNGVTKEFDLQNSYPYTNMLRDQIRGLNSSWAIRWHAAAFLAGKLTLYPGKSLVQNIGFDDSGTHTGRIKAFRGAMAQEPIRVEAIAVEENEQALSAIVRYFRSPKLFLLTTCMRLKHIIGKLYAK